MQEKILKWHHNFPAADKTISCGKQGPRANNVDYTHRWRNEPLGMFWISCCLFTRNVRHPFRTKKTFDEILDASVKLRVDVHSWGQCAWVFNWMMTAGCCLLFSTKKSLPLALERHLLLGCLNLLQWQNVGNKDRIKLLCVVTGYSKKWLLYLTENFFEIEIHCALCDDLGEVVVDAVAGWQGFQQRQQFQEFSVRRISYPCFDWNLKHNRTQG